MGFLRVLRQPVERHSNAGRRALTVNAYAGGPNTHAVRQTVQRHQAHVQQQQQVHLGTQQHQQQHAALEHLQLLQQQRQQHQQVVTSQLQRPQHHRQQQGAEQVQLLPLPASAAGWQQKQQLLPHPFCTLDPPALTKQVKKCRTWTDAAVLFAKQSQCMNHINLAALLTHLAHSHCSPGNRPVNWHSFVAQVLLATEPQLHLCSPRQLSNMAWALAKMGYSEWPNPSSSWAQQWQQQLRATLHSANCRDVSNILWAFATSGSSSSSSSSRESQGWRQQPLVLQQQDRLLSGQLQQELLSALHRTLPDSTPQDVSNALWAFATLQLQPPPELSQYLLARAQSHFSDFKPQEVAHVMWATSQLQLQLRPSSSWLDELLLRQLGRPKWQEGRVQHHVMCLVACANMQHMPPKKWIGQTLLQIEQLLLQPQQEQEQQQQEQQQQEGLDEQQQQEEQLLLQEQPQQVSLHPASSSTSSSSTLAHGGGSSSYAAGTEVSSQDRAAATPSSSTASGDSSSSTITADCISPSTSSSNRWHAQDLANTIWALSSLRIKPHPTWMQHFFAASTASLATANPQELSNTIWALAKLNAQPDAAWLAAFDAASSAAMRSFTARHLGDVLAAQVHLGLQPSGAWQEAWIVALHNVWGSADARAICKALWAAAKFQLPLGRQWLQQALQQANVELQAALISQQLSSEELLRLIWAVGRLCRGFLTRDLSDLLGLCCCRAAGKMSWKQLQRGAWGLARLKPLPSQQLTSYFCDLAASKVRYMPAAHAEAVLGKLQLLRDAAEVVRMQAAVAEAEEGLRHAAEVQQQQQCQQRSKPHADPAFSDDLQQQQIDRRQQQQQLQLQQQHPHTAPLQHWQEVAQAAEPSAAAAAVQHTAAADLRQMRAVLAQAQEAMRQAQQYHLQQHRKQLQLQQLQQQQANADATGAGGEPAPPPPPPATLPAAAGVDDNTARQQQVREALHRAQQVMARSKV